MRGDFGVFIKRIVEITEPKKKNFVWVLAFDIKILLSNGSDFVGGHGMILLDLKMDEKME